MKITESCRYCQHGFICLSGCVACKKKEPLYMDLCLCGSAGVIKHYYPLIIEGKACGEWESKEILD